MNKRIFLFPGSFDPPTKGHIDLAIRASALCDELVVAVLENAQKKTHAFDGAVRVKMLEDCFAAYPHIRVVQSAGLTVDLLRELHASCIIRGVRTAADYETEAQLAGVNRCIGGAETLLLLTDSRYACISSSAVRELLTYGRDVSGLVPEQVLPYLNCF